MRFVPDEPSGSGGWRVVVLCAGLCLSLVLAPAGTAATIATNSGGSTAPAPASGADGGSPAGVNGTDAGVNLSALAGVQSGGKVDVVFVVDDTGSMGNNIDGVRDNVREFASDIESEGIDAEYALITFSREPEVDQELTEDPGDIEDALDEVAVSGGTEDNFDALELATKRDFRPGAKRVIVDITDEDADLGPTDLRMPEVIEMLEPYSAYVAVSEDPPDTCADPPTASCKDKRALAGTLEDGSYVDLGQVDSGDSDFGDILSVVTEVVTEVAVQEEDGIAPDIEYVDTDVNRTGITPGEAVQVNATVVNEGDAAGEYQALFRKNLQLGETRRGFLDPGEEVDLSATLTFEEPGQYRVFVRQDFVATVEVSERSAAAVTEDFLDIEGRYVTRDHVWPGESYAAGAVVENTADRIRTFEVSFSRADGAETTRNIELKPDETRKVEVSRTAAGVEPPDARAVYVEDERVGNVTVHRPGLSKLPGEEEVAVTDGYVPRDEVAPGETYEVVAVVRNTGESGPVYAQFTGDDVDGGTTTGSLFETVSGGVDTVTYEATAPDEPGPVRWEVGDGITAGTVRVAPETDEETDDESGDATGDDGTTGGGSGGAPGDPFRGPDGGGSGDTSDGDTNDGDTSDDGTTGGGGGAAGGDGTNDEPLRQG